MKGAWEQPAAPAGEDADKDKKRRRRQNRRPKQNLAPLSVEAPPPRKASNVAFSSLPAMHMNRCGGPPAEASSEISRSCPLPASSSTPPDAPLLPDAVKVKQFATHWSDQAVEEAIQKGNAFKATFRVNAHNRLEAYCTIDGVPTDVLINGVVAQNRAVIISEARVLGLGPRFMSVYINKLAMERRIYYDDVEGLAVEWLDGTCSLVLDLFYNKRLQKRCNSGKYRAIEEVALVVNPTDPLSDEDVGSNNETPSTVSLASSQLVDTDEICPSFFPLVLQHLSSFPVALHAVGGDDGPLDIGARLYMCSYFS